MALRRSTLDDVMATEPNLRTRLLGNEELFSFRGSRSAGQLAKKLSEKKFMAVTLHAFVVFSMLFWWKLCILRCTGFLSALYGRNSSLVINLCC